MEILLWLVPSVVATAVAAGWVSWLGRDRRDEVDRDDAVRRLGAALSRELPARRVPPPAPAPRTGAVAVRPAAPADPGSAGEATRRAS